MSIQRGHEAVVLLVDDGVLGINGAGFEDKNGLGILRQNGLVFVATVFQRLESDGFTRCTKAIANPNMTHSVVLKNKNVKVIFTPSFDEAEHLLSEPNLVAVFLDDHLGDERVGCGGCKLLEEAVELDTRPSLYSISDGTYFNELLIPNLCKRYSIEIPILLKDDPELKGNAKLGHTPKVKDASQVISVIQAINEQYNADIKASMLLGAPEYEALNKA